MKKKLFSKILYLVIIFACLLLPTMAAWAQNGQPLDGETYDQFISRTSGIETASCRSLTDFKALIDCAIKMIVKPLVTLLIGLALLYFLWGIATYIRHLDDVKVRESGRMMMIWGIIALFVMICVWGLVSILTGTFQFDNTEPPIPTFRTS